MISGMRKSLDRLLLEHGYRSQTPATKKASVYVKTLPQGRFLVCLLSDEGGRLAGGSFESVMEAEARKACEQAPHLPLYPLAVVLTEAASISRSYCQSRFPAWFFDIGIGRLVIYEDQPDSFLDLRGILSEALEGGPLAGTRSSFGRRKTPIFRLTPVNIALIAVNILLFVIIEIIGSTYDADLMYDFGAIVVRELDLGNPGEWWRLLACAFLHFGFSHLFNNMLVLLYLGDNLEVELGPWRYLAFYLACAVISSLVSYAWYVFKGDTNVISAGASGAIFGVVGGLLATILMKRKKLEDIGPIQLLLLAGFTIYHGVTSAGVNNSAHISGLAAGIVLAAIFCLHDRERSITTEGGMRL